MIVKPSREDYRDYLITCVGEKVKYFTMAWTHHLEPLSGGHKPSSTNTQTTHSQVRHLYAQTLGFAHWHALMDSIKRGVAPWEDERFAYLDMNYQLISHLDDDFLDYIQTQRLRLHRLLNEPVASPSAYFSIKPSDHGPIEKAILLLYGMTSDSLQHTLNCVLTLNGRWPLLTGSHSPQRHLMLHPSPESDFTITQLLETCQAPGAIIASRQSFNSVVAQRFMRKELSLADPERNKSHFSTWSVPQVIEFLSGIMEKEYPGDPAVATANKYILCCICWMLHNSRNGHLSLDFQSLGEAVNLANYHISSIKDARHLLNVDAMSLAACPALFLRPDDALLFKSIVRKAVHGLPLSADQLQQYQHLFDVASRRSRPVRGMMLNALAEYIPILSEGCLNPQSQTVIYDHDSLQAALRWFKNYLGKDGGAHLVEELDYLPFGSILAFELDTSEEITPALADDLYFLLESCDRKNIQMVVIARHPVSLDGFSDYFRQARVSKTPDGQQVCEFIN